MSRSWCGSALLSGSLCLRQFYASDVGQSREEVPERADVVGGPAAFYVSGPGHDEWYADAALIEVSLDAAQAAVAVEVGRVGSTLDVRAVVGGEYHDGVVADSEAVKQGPELSDLPVQDIDHGGEGCVAMLLRPVCCLPVARPSVAALVGFLRLELTEERLYLLFRQPQLGMGNHRGVHHEEGAVAVLPDEVEGLTVY